MELINRHISPNKEMQMTMVKDLCLQIQALKEETAEKTEHISSLTSQVSGLTAEIDSLKVTKSSLEEKNSRQEKKIVKIRKTNEKLTRKNKDLQNSDTNKIHSCYYKIKHECQKTVNGDLEKKICKILSEKSKLINGCSQCVERPEIPTQEKCHYCNETITLD